MPFEAHMWEKVVSVLGNSHFEAYVGGPLISILFGFVFAYLARPPVGGNPAPNVVFVQLFQPAANNAGNAQTATKSDNSGLIAFALIGIVAVFMFAAYLPQISFALYTVIATIAAFTFTSLIATIIFGHFQTFAWWSHALFPVLASAISFRIAYNVEQSIDPALVQYAQSLIGNEALTVSSIINGAITFFKQVHPDYFIWMISQMGALMFTMLAVLFAFFQSVHYIALSHTPANPSIFWVGLVNLTRHYRGIRTVFAGAGFLTFAWLLTTGRVQQFFS